jgi:ribosomal protein S18 acetylase RimI-like enzyme
VTSKQIHSHIVREPWLRNADGSYCSLEWIGRRKRIVIDNKAFLLYDRDCDNDIFIHIVWVAPSYRRRGLASKLIKLLLKKKCNFFWCYANKHSRLFFKKMGFKIGKISYREVMFER